MIDYDWVTKRLALGSNVASFEDAGLLVDDGITHVLNCAIETRDGYFFDDHPHVDVFENGTADFGYEWYFGGYDYKTTEVKTTEWFRQNIEYTLDALRDPFNKVYIHCIQGMHRSPGAMYAVLRAMGITSYDAAFMIKDARPKVELIYAQDAEKALEDLALIF